MAALAALAALPAAQQDVLQVRAAVVQVQAPSGVVVDDAGENGRTNFNLLSGGVLYNEAVVVGSVTRVTSDPAALLAGGTAALKAAGVPQSMFVQMLQQVTNPLNAQLELLAQQDSGVSVSTTADSSYALASELEQAYVLGSAGVQPFSSGLSAATASGFDYWTETLSL